MKRIMNKKILMYAILLSFVWSLACMGPDKAFAAGDIPAGESADGEEMAGELMDIPVDDIVLNPMIETDEPAEEDAEAEDGEIEDYYPSDEMEVNTDLKGAEEDQVYDGIDNQDAGTAIDVDSSGFPTWLLIVLIAVGILIPIVTIVLKIMIDKSSVNDSNDSGKQEE